MPVCIHDAVLPQSYFIYMGHWIQITTICVRSESDLHLQKLTDLIDLSRCYPWSTYIDSDPKRMLHGKQTFTGVVSLVM